MPYYFYRHKLLSMNELFYFIDAEAIARRSISRFVQPTDEEWTDFYSRMRERFVKREEVYLQEGDVCKRIAFIVKGAFRMYYLLDGEERCKDFQSEGSFTGSLYSFISKKPSLFSVAALEDSYVLEMSREDLAQLYDNYKVWDRFGRMYMEQLFLYKERREASLLFDSSKQRYIQLLNEQPLLLQRIPQKYLASYLGIKPESLSRIRRQLLK
jgi:CRP-like cAMP-binding protein